MTLILVVLGVYLGSICVLPFPNWTSFITTLVAAARDPHTRFKQKRRMLIHCVKEFLMLPVWASFWLADEIFYSSYHERDIPEALFLFSQPRSGTTFLLRTLSEDKDTFLSVKHLEWRYPYISFWRLIDLLQLREWLEGRSYWPDTELGRICEKIHPHVLGNYEEFGIFLEERFYHHYFVFRRFPFEPVLKRVSRFDNLDEKSKAKMIDTFIKVVRKVYFHRGNNEIFLTKENENVEFCRALVTRFSKARILMICRDPQPMLNSYLTMSVRCTEVKHGIDPKQLPGWQVLNTEFRQAQCRKYIDFWNEVSAQKRSVLVTFDNYIANIPGSVAQIYAAFEIPIKPAFSDYLDRVQQQQISRTKGYDNLICSESGFEFYREFVRAAEQSPLRTEPNTPTQTEGLLETLH